MKEVVEKIANKFVESSLFKKISKLFHLRRSMNSQPIPEERLASQINFSELLSHFQKVQEKHRSTRRQPHDV